MSVQRHGFTSRRRPPVAAAWALGGLGGALLVGGVAQAAVAAQDSGILADARHLAVFALAAVLILLRACTVRSSRGIWLLIGLGAVCTAVAHGLWTLVYDRSATSPADALFGLAYLLTCLGLSGFLRRRVGDALRIFSFDALGITLYVAAFGSAFLLVPIMRHTGSSQLGAALSLSYPAADAALWSVIFAVASFTGRPQGLQDRLLGGAFVVMCLGDVLYVLGQAGWLDVAGVAPWSALAWEASALGIATAAWTRPSRAGSLRVGGWWESRPTLTWTLAGGGVLVAAAAFDLPAMVVVLGALTLVCAAVRGWRVVREVRDLVVVRAESSIDELTGAANQRALFAELTLLMREGGDDGQRVVLLICHLEGFDELTDALGHEAAGDLLRAVAQRLGPVAPGTLARLTGDEFATVVEDGEPLAVAAALEAALAQPVSTDGIAVSLRPIFGYARFPEDATTPSGLARRADVARRDAKERGLDIVAYDPARDRHSRERLELAADLRAALHDHPSSPDGLWLAFQPQVALADGTVCGVEALVRWCHPTRGELSPADVLPVAERSGQMSALTDWVLDGAVAEVAALRAAGHALRVSVNVSAVTLVDIGLPDRIAAALARHDVPADALVVEVTEDAVMRDRRRCLDVLGQLAALGVEISIDDFGTGQSSLAQLRHLRADELKIDRSFIAGMTDNPLDAELVRLVVALGRRMGVRVVAEGIETARQRLVLMRLGCDLIQGYGVGRPMGAVELREWLAHEAVPRRTLPKIQPARA